MGLELYKRTGETQHFDDSMQHLKSAEERLGDPEITTSLIMLERQFSKLQHEMHEKVEEM